MYRTTHKERNGRNDGLMEAGSWAEGLHVCVCVCVFGCEMLVSDQIQEIATACVSCHTVRDGEGDGEKECHV